MSTGIGRGLDHFQPVWELLEAPPSMTIRNLLTTALVPLLALAGCGSRSSLDGQLSQPLARCESPRWRAEVVVRSANGGAVFQAKPITFTNGGVGWGLSVEGPVANDLGTRLGWLASGGDPWAEAWPPSLQDGLLSVRYARGIGVLAGAGPFETLFVGSVQDAAAQGLGVTSAGAGRETLTVDVGGGPSDGGVRDLRRNPADGRVLGTTLTGGGAQVFALPSGLPSDTPLLERGVFCGADPRVAIAPAGVGRFWVVGSAELVAGSCGTTFPSDTLFLTTVDLTDELTPTEVDRALLSTPIVELDAVGDGGGGVLGLREEGGGYALHRFSEDGLEEEPFAVLDGGGTHHALARTAAGVVVASARIGEVGLRLDFVTLDGEVTTTEEPDATLVSQGAVEVLVSPRGDQVLVSHVADEAGEKVAARRVDCGG